MRCLSEVIGETSVTDHNTAPQIHNESGAIRATRSRTAGT
jgi:hypothetical protein